MITKDIAYECDGKALMGYLADGAGGRRVPGVLVCHQGMGLTEHARERARMLAELGHVAFALDMHGEVATSREQVMALIGHLVNARSNTRDPQHAATVGLASIFNTDSDLIFATDDVKIITGQNLELLLVCNIAVMGDKSVLNRFAYQATVFLQADNGTIAGTIRWNPHFLVFAGPEQDLFQINAWTMQAQPGASQGNRFLCERP